MSNRHGLRVVYFATAIAIAVSSIVLSHLYADSEWVAGGGSLMSAIALGYVFVQIRFERDLQHVEEAVVEKVKHVIADRSLELGEASALTQNLIQVVKAEIYKGRRSSILDGLVVALPGEVLNGFAGLIQRTATALIG